MRNFDEHTNQPRPSRPAQPSRGAYGAHGRHAAAPRQAQGRNPIPNVGQARPYDFAAPAEQWDMTSGAADFGQQQNFDDYARAHYGQRMAQTRNKGKRRAWTVVLVAASCVLVACLGVLGLIGWGYYSGTKTYDEVSQTAQVAKEADALAGMTVDWDALLAQNPDTVGWIYMPGTSIDYPIVQGDSDDEYLKKDFAGNDGGLVHKGAIFLSTVNNGDFSDDNNFIYGHNMNDDTMFAHLLAMADQETFDAARTFFIYTPTMNYRCSTFALDIVKSTETSIIEPYFADASAMASYASARLASSSVATPDDVDLSAFTKLFTLITCGDDYATTRAVLFGGVVEAAVPANAESGAGNVSISDVAAADDAQGDSSADDASADDADQAAA